jgi:hypothetical protein
VPWRCILQGAESSGAEAAGSDATWTSTGSCTQGATCTAGAKVRFSTCKEDNGNAATMLSLVAAIVAVVSTL